MAKDYAQQFYGTQAWKRCRKAYASYAGGLCERCLRNGLISPGKIVHHKIHLTPENIKDPDPNEYIPLVEKWNCIKRWDAAPELPGAMQFGKYITSKGILASVAHTQAEYEDIHVALLQCNARFPQASRV